MEASMRRKLEIVVLGAVALLGVIWALTTDHFPKHWFALDYLIDLSSLLTVASFSVRGMLPLRVLAAGSQVIAIPYFVLQPTPLWTPVGWTALFLGINLYHILRILYERRPVPFTPDEQRLYDLTFQSFEPRSFMRLLKLGEWKTAPKGERIVTRGESIERVAVAISGAASALLDDVRVGTMEPGALIGARMALTGRSAEFDAEFTEDARYVLWAVSDVRALVDKDPDLKIRFSEIVNRHFATQLDEFTSYLRNRGPSEAD
jgi:hypothetical protein